MLHVLIDSCIYRADRKRNKSPFRAVMRLASKGFLRLHVPEFVRCEVVSHQQRDVREDIDKVKLAMGRVLRLTDDTALRRFGNSVLAHATAMQKDADASLAAEFAAWMADAMAIVHAVKPDHGARVAAAYFAGTPPFRSAKCRDDFPDGFIWECALDLVKEFDELVVVSMDGRLRHAADDHECMVAYASLQNFIDSDDYQEALAELTPVVVAENIERIKKLLPKAEAQLLHALGIDIVDELASKTVRHGSIPGDNEEALIMSVGKPEDVAFDFSDVDHFGDGDIGIPFSAIVDCELNYTIYKGDYYSMGDAEGISISECNDHYFDAEETFTLDVEGVVTIIIDTATLENEDLTDDDLEALINDAKSNTEITSKAVQSRY